MAVKSIGAKILRWAKKTLVFHSRDKGNNIDTTFIQ